MEETKAEQDLAMAYMFPRGPDEKEMSRIKLLDLYERMMNGDYVFKTDGVEQIAR
jgi:hypothetical protein